MHSPRFMDSLARELAEQPEAAAPIEPTHQSVTSDDRSKNALRPQTFDEVIGQERAKSLVRRVVRAAKERGETLDHTLLVGAAGTGKTTFGNIIANELDAPCFQLAAPVSLETLIELRDVMQDGDVLFIDEIHMQAVQERRGTTASTKPEVFLQLLEDRVIATPMGMLEYPDICVIGATTDEGMLPDPFLDRFPLRPKLEPYTEDDLSLMACHNADALGLRIELGAAEMFGRASRGTPRVVNGYMKNARSLAADGIVTADIAYEVLHDLNHVTLDGLTLDQQRMLVFLYTKGRRETAAGEVRYQASVNTIATAIGKSRDSKAVALRVEPYLIEQGYVQVGHGGRLLTDLGIERARQLTEVSA